MNEKDYKDTEFRVRIERDLKSIKRILDKWENTRINISHKNKLSNIVFDINLLMNQEKEQKNPEINPLSVYDNQLIDLLRKSVVDMGNPKLTVFNLNTIKKTLKLLDSGKLQARTISVQELKILFKNKDEQIKIRENEIIELKKMDNVSKVEEKEKEIDQYKNLIVKMENVILKHTQETIEFTKEIKTLKHNNILLDHENESIKKDNELFKKDIIFFKQRIEKLSNDNEGYKKDNEFIKECYASVVKCNKGLIQEVQEIKQYFVEQKKSIKHLVYEPVIEENKNIISSNRNSIFSNPTNDNNFIDFGKTYSEQFPFN